MSADPKYPVGRFVPPLAWDPAATSQWLGDLAALPASITSATSGLNDRQLDTPYRDGGWTVRQVVHHLADSHLNAFCRCRLALTEEAPVIKPYEEARWAELPDARTAPIALSLQILDGLHPRWVALLQALTTEQWQRVFHHPDHERPLTLWHTAALYAWHGRHHTAHVIALREQLGWT